MEINRDLPNENKQAVYSELALAREAATVLVVGRESEAGRREGKLAVRKGGARCAPKEAVSKAHRGSTSYGIG